MKIALCQIDPIVADLPGNFQKILTYLKMAKERGAEIALFPELALFGYPPLDLVLSSEILHLCEEYLEKLVKASPIPFIVGLPTRCKEGTKKAYNSAAFYDGKEVHLIHKQLLPTYDVFDEARVFTPGPPTKPIEWKGKKWGILICEDGWQCGKFCKETNYSIDPTEQLRGVDVIISLDASPYRRGIIALRHKVFGSVAKKLKAPVIAICQVGANDGLIFDGSSFAILEEGTALQLAKSFEEEVAIFELDHLSKAPTVAPLSKTDELEKALILGVRDYFSKQGFSKAILGLSGGVDSAVAIVLVVKALGAKAVKALYLPTRFNASSSEEDALHTARQLDVDFSIIPIERIFEEFQEVLGLKPGLPLENLQPRIRSLILMSYANQDDRLMINTSNKSELSMGFSTIYGDLAGAISPLGDLWKEEVYELAKLYVKEGYLQESLLSKPPSAELRENQRDEDTLPPYPILDPLMHEILQEDVSINKLAQESSQSKSFILEILNQLDKSEYKRRQGPLVLKVSLKDMQSGRFFPIVQKRGLSLAPGPGKDIEEIPEI